MSGTGNKILLVRRASVAALVAAALCAGGCAASRGGVAGPATVAFPAESRGRAFEVARDVLKGAGYRLDRVDSEHGVLTTQAQPSGGLPTTSTPLTDVLHEQQRTVRVEFSSESAQVECFVSRTRTPEMRLSTRAIGLSATSLDPGAGERGVGYRFTTALTRDDAEAGRIAGRITRALRAGH